MIWMWSAGIRWLRVAAALFIVIGILSLVACITITVNAGSGELDSSQDSEVERGTLEIEQEDKDGR